MSLIKIVTVAALAAAAALVPGSANAAGPVEIARPGQTVDAGQGAYLTLTGTESCVVTADASSCDNVVDGNQPAGTVSLRTVGEPDGTLYSPLYIGDGRAARMTVADGGTTYDVKVVTLPGRPGYSTGYVWGAPEGGTPAGDTPQVTVYNAAGTVLASF